MNQQTSSPSNQPPHGKFVQLQNAPAAPANPWRKFIGIGVGLAVFALVVFGSYSRSQSRQQTDQALRQFMSTVQAAQRSAINGDSASVKAALATVEAAVKQFEESVGANERPLARAMAEICSYGMTIGQQVAEYMTKIEKVVTKLQGDPSDAELAEVSRVLDEVLVSAKSCLEQSRGIKDRALGIINNISDASSSEINAMKRGLTEGAKFEDLCRIRELDVECVQELQAIIHLTKRQRSAPASEHAAIEKDMNERQGKIDKISAEQERLLNAQMNRMGRPF